MPAETRRFDAEVSELLKLMINALYSNREIFLRELVSNASDACDRLRFAALTADDLKGLDQEFAIDLAIDGKAGTLSIRDNGIGMNREEVIENIGTIARSGTRRFLESLSGDQQRDAQLIGQFGVGFYSAFIVAAEVILETRRAGEPPEAGVRWSSTGQGDYRLETISLADHGTTVTLKLSKQHRDLLDAARIRRMIRYYSNHVAFPIRLTDGEGDIQALNDTRALWSRPKTETSDEDYKAFYTGLTGDPDAPLTWAHHHVEGRQRYSLLLYIPARAPLELTWNRDDLHGLKLYIRRVFIMDAADQLLPRYLRFMRGVVDSSDLPLNISREMLQDSPLLKKIRSALVKRSLALIEKLSSRGGEDWQRFWDTFGMIFKEGVIEDPDNRDRIAGLLRFATTREQDGEKVCLAEYIGRMPEDQDAIWYLTADNRKAALASPHLESFAERGVEVLLLTDRVDEWLVAHLGQFQEKPLKSVAQDDIGADGQEDEPDEAAKRMAGVVKKALGKRVGNVRPSRRLRASPSRIVTADGLSLHMRKLLSQAGQELPEFTPDLEINARHPLLELLAAEPEGKRAEGIAQLLLDQALLAEGGELADPANYVRQVNELLVQALGDRSKPA